MKIHSKYLNKDFEVSTTEEVDETTGEILNIVRHDSLVDVVKEAGLNVSSKLIFANQTEAVFLVKISDGKKETEAIGESNPNIAKGDDVKLSFRFTMAYNQAFDRAVIMHLQLPGRRIVGPVEEGQALSEANAQQTNTAAQTNGNRPAQSQPAQPGNNGYRNGQQQANRPAYSREPGSSQKIYKNDDFICTIGKYKANKNMTLKEIFEQDYDWMVWAANSYVPETKIMEQQKKVVADYLATHSK